MDRLFRQSSLIRDKWDELHGPDTYGNITIRNAITRTTEFYKPVDIGNAREDFNELAIRLTEFMPESNRLYKEGDLGNGRLFADVFKDIARYVPERKKWFIYDGKHWVADIGSLKAMELAKDLADAWLMNDETALALRKLKDKDGNYLWQEDMDTILGKPVYISEFMPSIATGKKVIAFGDFSYYWILNRRPLAVRALKEKFELYDQTGYLAMEYIDGKLVNREAIKVMQIS